MRSMSYVLHCALAAILFSGCSTYQLPTHPSIRQVVEKELEPTHEGTVLILNGPQVEEATVAVQRTGPDMELPKGVLASATRTAFTAVFAGGCDLSPVEGKAYALQVELSVEEVRLKQSSSFSRPKFGIHTVLSIKVFGDDGIAAKTRRVSYSEDVTPDNRQIDRVILMALLKAARELAAESP